jgi:hypothetical protein
VVAIGRATLTPGARVPAPEVPGPVLLAVESGRLELTTPAGMVWVRRAVDGFNEGLALATLAVGDGALVPAGTATTWRNVGADPLVVLVVTITAAIGPPAPATPGA